MAYNNYFPYPQFQQNQQQNSGFVPVRGIEEAYNWPIAPGNSITFKDENAPYVYTKTKGFSPMEPPVFERYRLVKEEDVKATEDTPAAFDAQGQIKLLWDEVNALKGQITEKKRTTKKEEVHE